MRSRISAADRRATRRSPAWPSGLAFALAGAAASLATTAHAQSATPLPPVGVKVDAGVLCPLDSSIVDEAAIVPQRAATSDTARLLAAQPGVALQTGGAVSSLPVLHGLGDDRLRILVDGMTLPSSCPNHMNPPLSYIDPTNVARAQVLPGITPVSLGGDSIGGTITVEAPPPLFAQGSDSARWDASVSTFYRSNGDGIATSGAIAAANDIISLGYTGAWAQAQDYTDGNGNKIRSTLFQTFNQAATLGVRGDDSLFVLRGGLQSMPYQGFPNQRMDLTGNHSGFVNGSYARELDWGKIDLRLYYQDIHHYMNFLGDKGGDANGGMPMKTHATDLGYRLQIAAPLSDVHTLRVGSDLDAYKLQDWWPPVAGSIMMGPGTYVNVNDGTRTRLGLFAEWEAHWTPEWTTLLGGRIDTVWMDAGEVQPYSWASMLGGGMGMGMGMGMSSMGMANPDADAARAFNAQSRARTDVNFDLTALARYEPLDIVTGEVGYARKTRSPNLYERYSWGVGSMAESMIGWFGDANLYQGNINLKPEVAHTFSVSAALHDSAKAEWEARITPYYTYIQDFIGANRIGTFNQGGSSFAVLRFANRDAQVYGVDLSGRLSVWGSAAYGHANLNGVVGWLQGNYIDTGKSLYHMMPLNALVSLSHQLGGWSSAAELQLVAPKALVDPLRNEPSTPGYAVLNLRTSYTWQNVRVDFAIENLLNQNYYAPLGGVDYADWKANGSLGQIGPLPSPGRSFIVGVTLKL